MKTKEGIIFKALTKVQVMQSSFNMVTIIIAILMVTIIIAIIKFHI